MEFEKPIRGLSGFMTFPPSTYLLHPNPPVLSLPPISVLPAGEFCRCTAQNVIHQKLARSAREVLTDYAIGTKSAQPGLMGGGGGLRPHNDAESI